MLHSIYRKIKARLRPKTASKSKCVSFNEVFWWDFQIFKTEEYQHILSRMYWACYRFFSYSPWGNPRQAYREIKWFIQRGRRGWADCDVWSLDSYLVKVISKSLYDLKKHKHGVPNSVVEPEDCGEYGSVTEEGMERAVARWDAIMDKMIAGFEANKRLQDGIYDDELGSYPLDRPSGVSADAWFKVKNNRASAITVLEERDRLISKEGLELFVIHFNSLWD